MKQLGYIKNKENGQVLPYFDIDENGYCTEVPLANVTEGMWASNKMWEQVDEQEEESLFTPQNEFEKAVTNICMELAETLIKKNRDYGDSYAKLRKEYGDLALIIRQSDKLERLKTLQKQSNLINESTTDTKKDGAGYYILDLAYERVNG